MKYLSTFSGIGGFEKGIQQAYENNQSWESLQRTERGSVQPWGNKSLFKVGGNEQPKTWGDRKLKQPENIGYSENSNIVYMSGV